MRREIKHYSTELEMHIKANAKERFGDKEAKKEREVATVATLDSYEKLPRCLPFDARHTCNMICDC